MAVLTDARFSGVSTGACVGHVSPEALAGGPIGKLRDGDLIRIVVDRVNLEGSLDLVGADGVASRARGGVALLENRPAAPDALADPDLPDDTRLWAALQNVGGGTWGGCVFDTDAIIAALKPGSGGELTRARLTRSRRSSTLSTPGSTFNSADQCRRRKPVPQSHAKGQVECRSPAVAVPTELKPRSFGRFRDELLGRGLNALAGRDPQGERAFGGVPPA